MATTLRADEASPSGRELQTRGRKEEELDRQPDPLPLLPVGSSKTVLATLQVVRTCHPAQRFSQSWLKRDHGVAQNRQAMRVLRYLSFLDGEQLTQPVLDSRTNLRLFRDLIAERVHAGCDRVGMAEHVRDSIGAPGKEWKQIRQQLLHSPPINALKPNVRNNVLGAYKALDNVVRNLSKEGWLDNLVNTVQSTVHQRNENSSTSSDESVDDQSLRLVYGNKNGQLLHARIRFDGPVSIQVLRKVGKELIHQAELAESSDDGL